MTKTTRKFDLAPGFMIQKNFSAKGKKNIQDPLLKREIADTLQAGYYALDSRCVNTPIGYFVAKSKLRDLSEAIREASDRAENLTNVLKHQGFDMRTTIEIVSVPVENVPAAKQFIAKEMLAVLSMVRDVLKSGNYKLYKSRIEKYKNLASAVQGPLHTLVQQALNRAEEQAAILKNGGIKGADLKEIGEKLDLKPLDVAIATLSESL